jgi:hypothetical protein
MDDIKQFKSLDDLKKIISDLEGFMVRPVTRGQHPTIYPDVKEGKYRTVCGVRVVDYLVSPDGKWVLPHNQKGLSFSSNWKELKRVYRLFSRVPGKIVDVHWILEKSDLPKDMKFIEDQDPDKKGHYFLTVTEKIPIHQLVSNLKWIADRMAVIKNAERAL